MKINIEIDCTPEEARYFMGLPDLKPIQAAIMSKLEAQVMDTMGNVAPTIMRAWLPYWMPFGGMSPEDMQKIMSGFLNTGQTTNGTPPAPKSSSGAKQ